MERESRSPRNGIPWGLAGPHGMTSVGLAINGLAWLVGMAIFRALSRIWKERSMPRYPKAFRAVYLLIALACLANAGCLAALVGAGAAAGGAGGYAYYKGNVCQS